jgi:hypothetical protein
LTNTISYNRQCRRGGGFVPTDADGDRVGAPIDTSSGGFSYWWKWSPSSPSAGVSGISGSRAVDSSDPPVAPGEVLSFSYGVYHGATARYLDIVISVPTKPNGDGSLGHTDTGRYNQPGVPSFSLNTTTFAFPAAGGNGFATVAQDLSQTTFYIGQVGNALYAGWQQTTAESWITPASRQGGTYGRTSNLATSNIYNRGAFFTVAANSPTGAARTGHILITVNDVGPVGAPLNSGTLSTDFVWTTTNIITITQAAGALWVDPGGGGTGGRAYSRLRLMHRSTWRNRLATIFAHVQA